MGFIINPYAFGAAYDADAQAFFTAAVITDNTQKTAVNQLVLDLKSYGIWTKMKALYPFVGGTATTHKYNLKDPQDTDAAFRLVFSGGWTHSATGALPNGTNAYADTKLQPSTKLSLNSTAFGVYLRTNTDGQKGDIGSYDAGTQTKIYVRLSNVFYLRINTYNYNGDSASNTNSTGFYINSRTASNVQKTFKNNSVLINGTYASGALSTNNIYLGAHSLGINSPNNYSDREQSFAFISDGLTDTDAANLYTAVQSFQTILGRNV